MEGGGLGCVCNLMHILVLTARDPKYILNPERKTACGRRVGAVHGTVLMGRPECGTEHGLGGSGGTVDVYACTCHFGDR